MYNECVYLYTFLFNAKNIIYPIVPRPIASIFEDINYPSMAKYAVDVFVYKILSNYQIISNDYKHTYLDNCQYIC